MNEQPADRPVITKEVVQARSSATGFCAMAFLGSLIYVGVMSHSLLQLVSVRGILMVLLGTLISAFVAGYLLLFCQLWIRHFAQQWLSNQAEKGAESASQGKSVTAQRLLSVLGTLLMVLALVLIFTATRAVYHALFL